MLTCVPKELLYYSLASRSELIMMQQLDLSLARFVMDCCMSGSQSMPKLSGRQHMNVSSFYSGMFLPSYCERLLTLSRPRYGCYTACGMVLKPPDQACMACQ